MSTSATTLEGTETVFNYNISAGPASLSVTFTSDVVAETTYECSVKLKQNNYTSAKSVPSTVTTPALTGKTTLKVLITTAAVDILIFVCVFFRENKTWHFM